MFEPDTRLLERCDDATGVSVVGVSDYKRRQPLSRHVSPPHPGEEGTSRHTTPSLLRHSRHTFAFSSLFPSEPTSDVTLLFQTISGVNKDSLLVGKEGVAAMLSDTPSGEYLQQAITSLQTHFFLPPVFSNTTIGAVAVREAITAGKSTILQQILHIPAVKQYLIENVRTTFVSEESIANTEMTEESSFSFIQYMEAFNLVKPSNSYTVINSLLHHDLLRLRLLRPVFCVDGWSQLLPSLFLSPQWVVATAYPEVEEKVTRERVATAVNSAQRVLEKNRQQFLRHYYLRQLEAEARLLEQVIQNYGGFLTEEYSIEEWLQGLIEVSERRRDEK